jgi:hypothetical protein
MSLEIEILELFLITIVQILKYIPNLETSQSDVQLLRLNNLPIDRKFYVLESLCI